MPQPARPLVVTPLPALLIVLIKKLLAISSNVMILGKENLVFLGVNRGLCGLSTTNYEISMF
jgi:hypothetical protein